MVTGCPLFWGGPKKSPRLFAPLVRAPPTPWPPLPRRLSRKWRGENELEASVAMLDFTSRAQARRPGRTFFGWTPKKSPFFSAPKKPKKSVGDSRAGEAPNVTRRLRWTREFNGRRSHSRVRPCYSEKMCDTLVVVGPQSVLFAKNSDRDPNEAQILDWIPRQQHAPGTALHCTWIEIPQVAQTHAVLLSRPFWMWGAEMGANEHGLVIGNEAVFTRQSHEKVGLTGMDLLRLALERATDAESAVRTIVELLETHGQGGGCGHEDRRFTYHNSFLVADPARAIVLETAGRHWATAEVSGARSISNRLTIPGFAEQHSDRIRTWASGARLRGSRTQCLAQTARAPRDLAAILRDHGEGHAGPRYSTINGGLNAPCAHAGGGLLAASQTTGSWIAELSPGSIRHWVTGTAAPCCGLFKPVRVHEPLDVGPRPTDQADDHSLWWHGERLHRIIIRNPAAFFPQLTAEREQLERSWFESDVSPAEAFREAAAFTDRWIALAQDAFARNRVVDCRPAAVRRYWQKRNVRAGLNLADDRVTQTAIASVT
jgi:secernin